MSGQAFICPECGSTKQPSAALDGLVKAGLISMVEPARELRVGDVVSTNQLVVRQIHQVDGDHWADEHGRWWHALDITFIRTEFFPVLVGGVAPTPPHPVPAADQAPIDDA